MLSGVSLSLIAVFTLLIAVTACDGGNGVSGTPSADDIADAEAAVAMSLLTIQDFPSGWISEPLPEGEEGEEAMLGLTGECGLLDDSDYQSPGQMADAESDTFIGPDDQEVNFTAAVFTSSSTAEDSYAHLTRLYEECRGQMEEKLSAFLVELLSTEDFQVSASSIDVSIVNLSLANDAPESTAMRLSFGMTVFGESFEGVMDFMALRAGRVVGQGFYFALGTPEVSEEEAFMNTFAEKMGEADESL